MFHIFETADYREAIAGLIRERKKADPRFNSSVLAEKIGIQKAYVSKVLKGQRDFSSDQAYLIAEIFALPEEQQDYLLLLVELARTGVARRQRRIRERILDIQARYRSVARHIDREVIRPPAEGDLLEYYLEPMAIVVHHFLQIPEQRKRIERLPERLGISEGRFKKILDHLRKMGLVEYRSRTGSWVAVERSVHLSWDSPVCEPHMNLFRLAAHYHAMKLPLKERFTYSTTVLADRETRDRIKDRMLKLIQELEPMIQAAPSREVFELSIDLFPWALDSGS